MGGILMTQQEMLDMKLHEYAEPLNDCKISVLRVPGGWLYITYDYEKGNEINSTFVPIPEV